MRLCRGRGKGDVALVFVFVDPSGYQALSRLFRPLEGRGGRIFFAVYFCFFFIEAYVGAGAVGWMDGGCPEVRRCDGRGVYLRGEQADGRAGLEVVAHMLRLRGVVCICERGGMYQDVDQMYFQRVPVVLSIYQRRLKLLCMCTMLPISFSGGYPWEGSGKSDSLSGIWEGGLRGGVGSARWACSWRIIGRWLGCWFPGVKNVDLVLKVE